MTKHIDERSPLISPNRKKKDQYNIENNVATDEEMGLEVHVGEMVWFEDAVTEGLRRLSRAWIFMLSMWYLSFVVKIGEIYFQQRIHFSYITSVSAVFIPMWIGSGGGIIMIARGTKNLCGCHKNLRIVSKEYQAYLHQVGADTYDWIAFESLPLLRFYYLWSVLSVLGVLCLVVTQALWYLWLVEGTIGMWHACIPVGLVCLVGVIYITLIKSVSTSTAFCLLLTCSWLILVTVKLSSELVDDAGHSFLTWQVVTTPYVVLQVMLLWKLGAIGWGYLHNTVQVLTRLQWMIWLVYFFASLLSMHHVWVVCKDGHTTDEKLNFSHTHVRNWLIIITLVFVGIVTTIRCECQHIARTKGFSSPIPLVKNEIGTFEPSLKFQQLEMSLVGTLYCTQIASPGHIFSASSLQQTRSLSVKEAAGHQLEAVNSEEAFDNNMVYDKWSA